MGKTTDSRQVYHVIHTKSGKVVESGTSKSSLRKKKNAMKNPHLYIVSKYDHLVEGKKKATKKVKESTGKVKKEKKSKREKKVKKSKKAKTLDL